TDGPHFSCLGLRRWLRVRKAMEQTPAPLGWRDGGEDLSTKFANVANPIRYRVIQTFLDFLANALRERGTFTGSGNRDLQGPAPNDGRKVKITMGRIIDAVAKDTAILRLQKHRAIDARIRRSSDYEECALDILRGKFARKPANLAAGGESFHSLRRGRRHDSD